MQHVWRMGVEVAEAYLDLVRAKESYEKSEEEFVEELMSLPGYPLPGPPSNGDELVIEITEREWSSVYQSRQTH